MTARRSAIATSAFMPRALHFRGRATVAHINIRKEGGADDERDVMVDVKLQGSTQAAHVCDFFDVDLCAFLFTDAGAPRNVKLEPIGFDHDIEQIGNVSFPDAKLSKWRLSAQAGMQVRCVFTATLCPSHDEIARLTEFIAEDCDVIARSQPTLFD